MDAILGWFNDNWFSLCQSGGIIGGLIFTAVSIRRDLKARRISGLLALTEQHRELWNEIYRRPDLERVFASSVDLVAQPMTTVEERFLNETTIHFSTGWQLACDGSLLTLGALIPDAKWFFSLPLPNAVWEQTKSTRDPKFVSFIEKCLRKRNKSESKMARLLDRC